MNGNLLGYKVWSRELNYNNTEVTDSVPADAGRSNEMELINLVGGQLYEIRVIAFNTRGHGPPSAPVDVYVGEAGEFATIEYIGF